MRTVYVAGPLTPKGNRPECNNLAIEYLANCRDMLAVSIQLIHRGWAPFCPAQDMLYFLFLRFGETITEPEIKAMSMAWLEASDAILLLNGWEKSTGSVAEYQRAVELGMPIYHDISEVPDAR